MTQLTKSKTLLDIEYRRVLVNFEEKELQEPLMKDIEVEFEDDEIEDPKIDGLK